MKTHKILSSVEKVNTTQKARASSQIIRFKNKFYQSSNFSPSGIVKIIARDDVEAKIINEFKKAFSRRKSPRTVIKYHVLPAW